MPVATPFNHLGYFTNCPPDVDVSSYDYWVTLGGYSKVLSDAFTPVTQAQIDASLANAMKMYWNLYSFTIGYEIPSGTQPDETFTATALPSERVCPSVRMASLIEYTQIVRMFDGLTFVGYGISGLLGAVKIGGVAPNNAIVAITSYRDNATGLGVNEDSDLAYGDIAGIDFVIYAYAYSDDGSPVADSAAKTANSKGYIVSLLPASGADALAFYTY